MSEKPSDKPTVTSTHERVGLVEKIGYGLGDTASNFFWKLFEFFQLYFYTDVFGISAAAAGTMFFVTRLWDAINDPLIGFLSDRTKTAWGRFRPYLLWGAIPLGLTGVMTFYTPDLSPRGKLIYAYITYTLMFMAYTAVNIPYGALMGVISSNSKERTSVSTFRFILAFAGGLVVQWCTIPLVTYFGRTFGDPPRMVEIDGKVVEVIDQQTGFVWTVGCYAVLACLLFFITFLTTRERVAPQPTQRGSFRNDLADLLTNRPWVILLFVGLFQIFADFVRGSAVAYYFKYLVDADFSMFLVSGTFFGIVGMLMTRWLTSYFDKRDLLIMMNLAKAILTGAFFFLEADQIWLMYTLNCLAAFISGPVPVLLWAMYADTADYSEWKNGRRATGLIFSAATFSQKLGCSLGVALPAWMLAYFQFKPPVDGVMQTQSDATIFGIVSIMSWIPATFLLGAVAVLFFYNLTDSRLEQIERDLKSRNSTPSPAES